MGTQKERIQATQGKKHARVRVQAPAYAIEDSREMLAKGSRVRAGTAHMDFFRKGYNTVVWIPDQLPDVLGDLSLQKFQLRGDLALQKILQELCPLLGKFVYGDAHIVHARTAHHGGHKPLGNLQITDTAMAKIALAPGKPVFVVRVALHVVAPALSPEGMGNLPVRERRDGLDIFVFLAQFVYTILGVRAFLGYRHIIEAKVSVPVRHA